MTTPILPNSLQQNLLAIQRTQRIVDVTALRLSTGRKVNSALDNPSNFFTARSLDNRADDLSKLLDGIGSAIRTVQEATSGVQSIEQLLDLAEAEAQSALEEFVTPDASYVGPPLQTQILASSPVGYWRFNETAGATSANLGTIGAAANANYLGSPTLGAAPLYDGGDVSVQLNGTNQAIAIPNHPQINTSNHPVRSVEVVFNANTTAGRQVLYEEGGGTNAFSIYVFNGNLYLNGRDAGAWGPLNINAPINAGETYHAAFTFDFPNGIFRGYLNGVEIGNGAVNAIFPSHSGNVGIGRMDNATWFHDGSQAGSNFYFNGRISDVAIYNSVLSATTLENHAASVIEGSISAAENPEFSKIMDQIDNIVKDAHYRGINLLGGDNLTTYFNPAQTSMLEIKGVDFTSRGLGIQRAGFHLEDSIHAILEEVRAARNEVRQYGTTLATQLNVLKVREIFTEETVNTLTAGALDLTIADDNEEGANMLATQTRLNLATTSLSLNVQSRASILTLFA